MSVMFLMFLGITFHELNSEFIATVKEYEKKGYVWKYDPDFITKDSLAIAFEGNGKRLVIQKMKKE
tara:strand:- start:7607 stop:7804 length:198 start_codon:yes stop_codon:yes gene_type:complete